MHRFYDFIFQNLACINFLVSIQRFNLTAYIITFKRTTLNCLYFSVVIWQAASIGMHEVVAHSLKLYSISKRVCTIMKYTEKLTFYGEKNFTDFSFYVFFERQQLPMQPGRTQTSNLSASLCFMDASGGNVCLVRILRIQSWYLHRLSSAESLIATVDGNGGSVC